MATPTGILLPLLGLLVALLAMASTAGRADGAGLEVLAREIARRRQASKV